MRKDVVLAPNASWLFRVIPYLIFAATWVAASLVPTFGTGLVFSWSADLIAIIALLGSARFFLALAGLDVGTTFGGIGSSREVMIASLAEPAMIMIVFTLALIAGSTQLSTMAEYMLSPAVGLRVSLGLALLSLTMVAIAENARIPVDNPATHLELTMVHEAMVLEYSGRHLAVDLQAAHDPVQRRRDDEALHAERDRRGHEEMRRVLGVRLPGHGERQCHRLHGEHVEHGGDAVLVEQDEAQHQHGAGEQMGDIEGERAHQNPRDTNSRKTASAAAAKAPPRKMG